MYKRQGDNLVYFLREDASLASFNRKIHVLNPKQVNKLSLIHICDLSLTQYLVPQECGMRMDTEWLEITRHTALDNSRTDSSSQTLLSLIHI